MFHLKSSTENFCFSISSLSATPKTDFLTEVFISQANLFLISSSLSILTQTDVPEQQKGNGSGGLPSIFFNALFDLGSKSDVFLVCQACKQ